MFRKLLVANRGEIACRVMRTARRLGVRTVAVYSDADHDALHVRLADEARRIGPAPAAESYLSIEAILEAARAAQAQAVHPGYGFLSENDEFAAACQAAGIVFVGPPAKAIAAMGDKSAAKRLMEKAGVPLVPGYHGEKQELALLHKEAERIGYPVLIKPSAGGGGKGMRTVREAGEFAAALQAARREAKSAFGDDRVLIERYLEKPRHIEIQVFGDTHGNLVHLFERDCSVQRRHQKVLEEAPAPGLPEKRRREMGEAAVAAARAIGYVGAGTVEFIAGPDGSFYFMEMNTRLQVEHPVTEMITGEDLVEWQLRVACGERLPKLQDEIAMDGHAIEARIYAEDPARDFLPATGRLVHLAFPEPSADVRIDAGVEAGGEVTPWYDPMIAKLIVRGRDRPSALARLRRALSQVEIAGVATNTAFLGRLVSAKPFDEADLDTGLIERTRDALLRPEASAPTAFLAAAACAELAEELDNARGRAQLSGDRYSPWHDVDGWRLNEVSHHDFVFVEGADQHLVRIQFSERAKRIVVGAQDLPLSYERLEEGLLRLTLDGRVLRARCVRDGADWHVFSEGAYRKFSLRGDLAGAEDAEAGGSLAAPMPGKVIQLLVEPGARVVKGQALLILEAMKMEHTVSAPSDGTVTEIHFSAGEQVLEGAQLITLEQA